MIETPGPTQAIKQPDGDSALVRKMRQMRTISEKTGITLPLSVVIAAISVSATFLYNGMNQRMEMFEKQQEKFREEIQSIFKDIVGTNARVLKVEIDGQHVSETLVRIERGVDNVNDKVEHLSRKVSP
jgi:hypothetical protein